MPTLNEIINIIIQPFINFRNKVFNLIYKEQEISENTKIFNKLQFKQRREDFWKKNLNQKILDFYLDGTVNEHPYKPNIDNSKKEHLWFEAAIFREYGEANFPAKNQYIIMICDFNHYYEEFAYEMEKLTISECNIIAFNPPGMGRSPGTTNSPADYQIAVEAIIEELHFKKGIPYDNITLLGNGFGAGIALMLAAEHQRQGEPIKVIADRSYPSTALTEGLKAQQKVHEYFNNKFLRTVFGTLAYYLANGLVRLLGLNIDAAQAYATIYKINPEHVHAIEVKDQYVNSNEEVDFDIGFYKECRLSSNDDITGNIKIFKYKEGKILSQNVPLKVLYAEEEPSHRGNAEAIVGDWLDEFKKHSKPELEWSQMAEPNKRPSVFSENLNRCTTYMYEGINKLWNVGKVSSEGVYMDIERQELPRRDKTARTRNSGGS